MKKQSRYMYQAVAITAIATAFIFGLAWYIFGQSSPAVVPQKIQVTPTVIKTGAIDIPVTIPTIATGVISSSDKACTREYDPVCGVDGQTYANLCLAGEVSIDHKGACQSSTPTAPGAIASENPATTLISSGATYDTGSYLLYESASFGYGFAMTKNVMYEGMGGRDGANHTVGINLYQKDVDTVDFALATVQVYFYKKPPTTPPANARSVNVANGTLYVVNNDTTNNPKITRLVDTILASAK